MNEIYDVIGKPAENVPTVDAEDIKTMWKYGHEVMAQHPGATSASVGFSVWKNICSPGADIMAVSHRCNLLTFLESVWVGGEPSDGAFRVAAKTELKYPQVGVVREGLHFNLERFLLEIKFEKEIQGLAVK
jgi:hypothetical protein